MRDFIVLAIILGATPICFFRPYFGVLMWTWVAYFNPHRFTWGVAYNFPVAMLIGGATLAGLPFAKERNRRIFTSQTILLILLWSWYCITTLHVAYDPIFEHHLADSKIELIRTSKILLMTLLMIWLVTTKEKLRYLYLVTTLSFGFFAVKGTLFACLGHHPDLFTWRPAWTRGRVDLSSFQIKAKGPKWLPAPRVYVGGDDIRARQMDGPNGEFLPRSSRQFG